MTDSFLANLYAEGVTNDQVATDREQMRLNITPNTGRFLDILITDSRLKDPGTWNIERLLHHLDSSRGKGSQYNCRLRRYLAVQDERGRGEPSSVWVGFGRDAAHLRCWGFSRRQSIEPL